MNRQRVKNRITVRLRQQLVKHNVSKELSWLKMAKDDMREEMGIGKQLGWFDTGIPSVYSIYNMKENSFYQGPLELSQLPEGSDEENVKLFFRGKLDELPLTDKVTKVVDLEVAHKHIPCFGSQYRACTNKKKCHLAGLCKQESSRMLAVKKHGTESAFLQVRDYQLKHTQGIKIDESLENVSKEQVEKWMKSDRMQYYRYLKHTVFNDEERIALEAATYYENRVKKIIRKPFFVVLGKSGDITQHKNWSAFMRIAKRAMQHNADIEQYMAAQFHFSHSKTGYPPLNSLGSENAGKRYLEYIDKVIKRTGTKMVRVWESKDPFYADEDRLVMMWNRVRSQNLHLFPSKDFYLFHGMHLGLGRTEHFTEPYLRKKYPGKLYKEVENRYLEIFEVIKRSLPKVYLTDMNKPALFTDIYAK